MAEQRVERLDKTYPKLPRDSEGWWICRYCKKRITQGRRYRAWCSDACSNAAMERTYSDRARRALEKRQNGICCQCGLDTTELDHTLDVLKSLSSIDPSVPRDHFRNDRIRRRHYDNVLETLLHAMKRCGFNTSPFYRTWGVLWHMDHIVEHAEGGTMEPDNLQTLCIPCHKRKTKTYVGNSP